LKKITNTDKSIADVFEDLYRSYPALESCRADIKQAFGLLVSLYQAQGHLLICGNGGSAADAEHLVAELMKSFKYKRGVTDYFKKQALHDCDKMRAEELCSYLEGALPAISLVSQTALATAFGNDRNASYIFAQQVYGYGRKDDVLLAISTSGNSQNIITAAEVAKIIGMKILVLTGEGTGKKKSKLSTIADYAIRVPAMETYRIQELHLPIYHALAAALEVTFFEPAIDV